MSPLFLVQLSLDGRPEPMFCSVCHEFQEMLVYFLSGNIEVSMCHRCVMAAGTALLQADGIDAASKG